MVRLRTGGADAGLVQRCRLDAWESYSEKQLLTRLRDDERHDDGGGDYGVLRLDLLDRSKPNRVLAVSEAITTLPRLS